MTADDFRRLALKLPHAIEGAHQGHADFRVGGKVFATLGYPGPKWAMVKLDPDDQAMRVEAAPEIFAPVKGAWGRQGYTNFLLQAADDVTAEGALLAAWRRTAPRRLQAERPPTGGA